MKAIQEVAEEAALVLMFENTETLPMTEITFSPKGEEPNYSIRVPKAFLEEIYAIGFKEGFSMRVTPKVEGSPNKDNAFNMQVPGWLKD
jgi:hypothetical protein